MYYRWGEGDLLLADTGVEYVTSLSIGLVTPCGVSIFAVCGICVCVRERKHRHSLCSWASAEDSRYRVMGIKWKLGNIQTWGAKGETAQTEMEC